MTKKKPLPKVKGGKVINPETIKRKIRYQGYVTKNMTANEIAEVEGITAEGVRYNAKNFGLILPSKQVSKKSEVNGHQVGSHQKSKAKIKESTFVKLNSEGIDESYFEEDPQEPLSDMRVIQETKILQQKILLQQEKEKEIDKIVSMAPENVRPFVRDLVEEYFRVPQQLKPKYFETIMSYLKDIKQLDPSGGKHDVMIPYVRPDWLADKQNYIADRVQEQKNFMIHGDRQTGKDSSIAVGVFEKLIKSKCYPIYFMASNIRTTRDIKNKIMKTEDRFKYIQPFVLTDITDKVRFKALDGTVNEWIILPTTEGAIKGLTGTLWIDDIDTIIKDGNKDVISKALAITRSNPDLNVIFTSNMGKGAYITLLEEWKNPKWTDYIEVIELTKDDVHHISAAKDEFLFASMKALSGKSLAEAQLLNKYDHEGDSFDPESLTRSLEGYEYFITSTAKHIPIENIIMFIDPSGTSHKHGHVIIAFGSGYIWLLDSGSFLMGDYDVTGEKITPERLQRLYYDLAVKFRVKRVGTESNSDGSIIAISLRAKNVNVTMQNFQGSKLESDLVKIRNHENMTTLTRWFFDNDMIYINSEELRGELLTYNPLKGSDELNKGNMADALIQAIWLCVGGIKYIQETMEQGKRLEQTYSEEDDREVFY